MLSGTYIIIILLLVFSGNYYYYFVVSGYLSYNYRLKYCPFIEIYQP